MENHGNPSVKEFKTGLTVDLSPQRKKFEKLYKQVSQNEKADSVEKLKILKILTPLFKGHSSIAEIPKHFLTIPGFKEYQSCHMFLQERGTTTVEHYFSREGKAFKSLEMDAQSFNKIFNLIRKSKHKIFHHNLIPDLDMKLVGTFLANSTSLKTHNFILIVSRNDFLQPSMNEIKNFDEFFLGIAEFY